MAWLSGCDGMADVALGFFQGGGCLGAVDSGGQHDDCDWGSITGGF